MFSAFADDRSGKYRVRVEEITLSGFTVAWRWYVFDVQNRMNVVDTDIAHRDADAWCEGWAIVALLLSRDDSKLEGAYSIGLTQY